VFRTILTGLRTLVRRQQADRDLDDEIRHYIQLATEERTKAGMAREQAARAARLEIGGVEPTKELVRSATWEAQLESLWRDFLYALRGLRRNPAFTAVVTATLALGIGANTVMFTVVDAVMLRGLPYSDPGRLVLIWTDDVRRSLHREPTAYRTIVDWKERTHAFADIAYYNTQRVSPTTNNPAVRGRARNALVSGNLFGVLGVHAALGRTISTEDDASRADLVVISYGFWQRWFGGAADVIGRTLTLVDSSKEGTSTLTVIGVMPAGFYFPDKQTDLWTPAAKYWRFTRESSERFPPWARRWTALARIAPGASVTQARIEMARVQRELTATYPTSDPDFPGFAATVLPILDSITGTELQSGLWILFGATALVLLVACANVANLLLARSTARQHEFAVRRALGGGRVRLVRQLAIEHLALAMAGGFAGLLLAVWGMRIVRSAAAPYVPRIDEATVDARVLVAATLASVAAALLFGIVPALRLSTADARDALRDGTRTHGSRRIRTSRRLLVLAECALAMVLLAGAGLLLRSLGRLLSVDPGFDPRGVLTLRLEFPPEPAPSAQERLQTSTIGPTRARAREQAMEAMLGRLKAIPGVERVAFIDDLYATSQGNDTITIPSRAIAPLTGELNSGWVTSGFFDALRVPLKRGRLLSRDDGFQRIRALWSPVVTSLSLADKERRAVPEPVVVNESFVRRFFPGEDAVGKRFCIDPANKTYWYEIVGVIGDMHRQGLEHEPIPEYFGPYFPSPNGRADLLVRTLGAPLALASAVRQELTRVVPSLTIVQISTADAQLADFSGRRRLQTGLLSAFAFLALSLAGIGIFGLVHYTVSERTGEMAVRIALGATPRDLLSLVLAQGMRTPLAGIAVGTGAAVVMTRVMNHLLFRTTATDPVTFFAVTALLTAVAAVACYVAARRAMRLDPLQALRAS
jgi:putative ABC transport system permease protein